MTDFTPEIRIMVLPPNTIHSATKTEITGWVDYNFNIFRGTNEFINPPYPGTSNLSLLFDENVIPDIQLGSWVEVQVKNSAAAYVVLHAGNVTNRTSQYRNYGLEGFVLEWQFDLTSPISRLQNTDYYLQDTTTGQASGIIDNVIYPLAQAFTWSQINGSLTWNNYGPDTWAEVDLLAIYDFPTLYFAGDPVIDQTLTAGNRNLWDDITQLWYGMYCYIIEKPDGGLDFYDTDTALVSSMTITADMLSTNLTGNDRFDTLRNVITLIKHNDTELSYYDNESMALFGDRTGTLNTEIVNTADIAVVGAKILNAMSYPILSTEQIDLNLLNPIFTNAERDLLLTTPLGLRVTVQAPVPMGGTMDYLTIGINYTINKNAFILDFTLVPYSSVVVSSNWEQIPYNYTWTSYGVAFPTQQWQDL